RCSLPFLREQLDCCSRHGAMADSKRLASEIDDLFGELDALFKNTEVGAWLSERGVNVSLAMVAADGLRAYVKGDKAQAAEDFATVAEEIRARLETARQMAKSKPS